MSIVAIISSPEKNGNTEAVVNKIAETAKAKGVSGVKIDSFAALKQALDPRGMLNPGNLFPV